jgi:hypothetical protein
VLETTLFVLCAVPTIVKFFVILPLVIFKGSQVVRFFKSNV